MGQGKTISRSELYKLVWSEPISRIARSHGLSDVGLAKICKRHDVPRPPRGYWAQRQHGYEPEQVPLPKPEHNPKIEMRERVPSTKLEASSEDEAERPALPHPVQIVVAETLRGCHDLVSKANKELEDAATDSDGLIVTAEDRTLDVRTSKACTRRALLILDALVKECERQGYAVTNGPTITIQEHRIRLGISEVVESKREEVGDADLSGPYTFGHSRYDTKRIPTGRLTLAITQGRGYWASGSRATWRDTDKSRLEDKLGKVLLGLVETADLARQHEAAEQRRRERAQQEEARRQEEALQLAERRKQYKAEKARVAKLLKEAENLRKSQAVRELIEAVRQQHSAGGPIAPGSQTAAWLEWATSIADRLDPLRPSPPSILDEKLEEPDPPSYYRPTAEPSPPSYWEQRNWWNRNR